MRCRPWCSRSPRTGRSRRKDWFRTLYRVFLGQSQGPRIGSFIALLGYAQLHRAPGGAPGPGGVGDERQAERPQDDRDERGGSPSRAGRRRAGCAGCCRSWVPAFIASVAYMDPGNFATNIQGGAQFGYMLLWVILASNLMAMLLQTLSAKLGIATGKNLAEHCREQFRRPVVDRDVGPGGDRGHGHGPGRVPRRGAGLLPPARRSAAGSRASSPPSPRSSSWASSASASGRWRR